MVLTSATVFSRWPPSRPRPTDPQPSAGGCFDTALPVSAGQAGGGVKRPGDARRAPQSLGSPSSLCARPVPSVGVIGAPGGGVLLIALDQLALLGLLGGLGAGGAESGVAGVGVLVDSGVGVAAMPTAWGCLVHGALLESGPAHHWVSSMMASRASRW